MRYEGKEGKYREDWSQFLQMKYKTKYIVLVVTLALLCGLALFNSYNNVYAFKESSHPRSDSTEFSIMTFNIAATDSSTFTNEFQNKLLQLIKKERPDILCFQELLFANLIKIRPHLDSIYGPCEVLNGGNQIWRMKFYSSNHMRNFNKYKSVGDLDTYGMTDEEISYIGQSRKQMRVMSAEFEVGPDKWVRLYSGHLRSSAYSTARRSMEKDASWSSGLGLYWRNYKVGKRIRGYEADNVRRFIDEARSGGIPVIVAGDLNDWSGSNCIKALMSNDLKDAWWEGGRGFGWTYCGWHLRLRLDHILYSDELELVDVKVIDSDLSDHKPLMARFRIK